MTPARITIIQGHPDPSGAHFGNALSNAYAEGATQVGHTVRQVNVALLDFPILRRPDDFYNEPPCAAIAEAQDDVKWAEHVAIFYPLWHGDMPAYTKGFFEQLARPGFGVEYSNHGFPKPLLRGRSARVVVTMGMPEWYYRWFRGAYTLKSLERNILKFAGITPVFDTVVSVGLHLSERGARRWLKRMRALGGKAR